MQHKRKANRMIGYDYTQDNLYFVTSCVKNRVCCFGEIISQKMVLNEYGKIAEKQWHWLGQRYSYVRLHQFVVMPDHIHGIIEINRSHVFVGTGRDPSLQKHQHNESIKPIKIKSLSELMGAYKTTTSKQIHLLGFDSFAWQRSFHDHIIRDEKSFINISNYIATNPIKGETNHLIDNIEISP
jgi:REP element-mobilizing transposase RayT